MLSENLNAIGNRFAEYTHSGMQLDGAAVLAFCAVIKQAAEDARALEQATIPTSAQTPCHVIPAHRVKGMLVVYDGGRS